MLIFSSVVSTWAKSTVKSGVAAFRIAATPEASWVWPQTISAKGIALLRSPIPKNAAQTVRLPGIAVRVTPITSQSIAAAIATRANTTVSGGSAATVTALKKNDPPQSTDRNTSSAQSRRLIGVDRTDDMGTLRCNAGSGWHLSHPAPLRRPGTCAFAPPPAQASAVLSR